MKSIKTKVVSLSVHDIEHLDHLIAEMEILRDKAMGNMIEVSGADMAKKFLLS